MMDLFLSFSHGLHVENCLHARHGDEWSEGIQHLDSELYPSLVIHRKSTIGLSEAEILDEKVLDVGVFRDGARAVAHVIELLLFKVMLVQVLIQAVVGIKASPHIRSNDPIRAPCKNRPSVVIPFQRCPNSRTAALCSG